MTKKPVPKALKGRPPVWQTKIEAPEQALILYNMIASLQNSDAFKGCHIYKGASDGRTGIPMFKFEGRVHAMPYVISSYMGIRYGQKVCETPGCINPFHFAVPTGAITIAPPQIVNPNGDLDLIEYYVEEVGIRCQFNALRAAIPVEDISDANLRTAIGMYSIPSQEE